MIKILQARLQQYINRELPDVQAGFIKDRGTRNQIDIFFAAKDGEALYSQNLWDAVKAVRRGKFIAIQPYLKK